eukprot:3235960-Amphidinium_carterae.1
MELTVATLKFQANSPTVGLISTFVNLAHCVDLSTGIAGRDSFDARLRDSQDEIRRIIADPTRKGGRDVQWLYPQLFRLAGQPCRWAGWQPAHRPFRLACSLPLLQVPRTGFAALIP